MFCVYREFYASDSAVVTPTFEDACDIAKKMAADQISEGDFTSAVFVCEMKIAAVFRIEPPKAVMSIP
jgi:hypothetical protein